MSDLARSLAQMENRQRNLVRNLIARGEVSAVTVGNMQGLQAKLFAGEVKGGIEHFEPYGFTSHPLAGAEPVVLFPGGDRSHGIAIVVADRRYRVKVQPGEVAVHDDQGQVVHLKRDGIHVESPFNVTVKAADVLRLEGREVHLHAAERFRFDVNGHGQDWCDTYVDTWTIGETAGTPHPITPPEIP